ncbi:unnamed protein product [Blepharisma stoltei]|uniref:Uncharacterized protein n=1 Tax=Blepharisma stoltei TaxID=1481888 RepID=A0AAU9JZH6_9CILI|nr:unnamed protein product [Blepharisma stoltei]
MPSEFHSDIFFSFRKLKTLNKLIAFPGTENSKFLQKYSKNSLIHSSSNQYWTPYKEGKFFNNLACN